MYCKRPSATQDRSKPLQFNTNRRNTSWQHKWRGAAQEKFKNETLCTEPLGPSSCKNLDVAGMRH